jgi:hypothetical protein
MAEVPKTPDISSRPLLLFMERLDNWRASARAENFWRDRIEHQNWADQLRDEAKGIIVWLELKGQDEAAARFDHAMRVWREAIWHFQERCEGVYPADDWRCREARDEMIAAAGRATGAAEDLDSELPEEVWEGFFDA